MRIGICIGTSKLWIRWHYWIKQRLDGWWLPITGHNLAANRIHLITSMLRTFTRKFIVTNIQTNLLQRLKIQQRWSKKKKKIERKTTLKKKKNDSPYQHVEVYEIVKKERKKKTIPYFINPIMREFDEHLVNTEFFGGVVRVAENNRENRWE